VLAKVAAVFSNHEDLVAQPDVDVVAVKAPAIGNSCPPHSPQA
jgi:hypothetical protein